MPGRLTKQQRETFLRGRHVCVLGTIGPEGEPVLTPIWYLYDDGKIVMRTGETAIKTLNIARDSRVTVCVQDERPPYKSVTGYGTAAIEPERPVLATTISRHYLGAVGGAAYVRIAQESIQQGDEVTIVMTPERWDSQDFAAETPFVGRIWLVLKRLLPPWL
jgi:PPOX class probable F420-dependent enzyme